VIFFRISQISQNKDDEKFIQSRRALRKIKLLNQLKEGNVNDNLIFELDTATEEAARNVASIYDRLGLF
jgi:hypothetical protein